KQKVNNFEDWKEPKNIHTFFNNDLSRLIKESIFKPKIENIPVVGDSIVMLASDNMKQEGNRYILYAKKRPIIYNSDNVQYVNKMEMDNRKTYNKTVTLSTLGDIIIYAQNDPLWGNLIYEVDYSDKRRRFKDGACGPVAVATVVANLVDKEDLPKIKDYALNDEGFSFCSCSVNQYWCSKNHIRYIINTPDEFLRYLPIVIGNFSTGNNIWNRSGRSDRYGTSLNYLGNICEIYDINIHKVQNVFEAIEKLKAGKTLAIASVTSASAFTDNSHFIVLVGVDDKYLYVIDPLRRDTYMPKDERKLLDIMTPGLVRIKLEDVYKCGIFSIFILDKNPPMMQEEIHIPYN
ncbi:MAG: hypothetical protein GYA87_07790, partial [Christensenellaceae bacterium]|nr:hypothetical protein [Christensenellaceae bacterium]